MIFGQSWRKSNQQQNTFSYTSFERLLWMAGFRTKTWKLNKGWSQIRPKNTFANVRSFHWQMTVVIGCRSQTSFYGHETCPRMIPTDLKHVWHFPHIDCVFLFVFHTIFPFSYDDTTTVLTPDNLSVAVKMLTEKKICCNDISRVWML